MEQKKQCLLCGCHMYERTGSDICECCLDDMSEIDSEIDSEEVDRKYENCSN